MWIFLLLFVQKLCYISAGKSKAEIELIVKEFERKETNSISKETNSFSVPETNLKGSDNWSGSVPENKGKEQTII